MDLIKLNDILRFDNLKNVKIRFNLMFANNWNPIQVFLNNDLKTLLEGQYWNYSKNRSFKLDQITVGLLRIHKHHDCWLLFHVGHVTKDLKLFRKVGYEYEIMSEYEKYFGKLIIRYKNTSQNMIRNATSVIDKCEVVEILNDNFDNQLLLKYDCN